MRRNVAPLALTLSLLGWLCLMPVSASAQGFPPVGGGGTCTGMINEEGFQGQQSAVNNGLYLCSGGVWVKQPLILGTTASACSATWSGGIRYNSVSGAIEFCNGTSWANVGGGGGGTPAGADREIQFNSGGAFGASSTYKLMADGDLLLTGTYTGTASVPASGAGTRMFFDTQKAAFRSGKTGGLHWDNASVGDYSVATGMDTTASGIYSVAMGAGSIASGLGSTAMGTSTTASGNRSMAMGNATTASGAQSTAMGDLTTAAGDHSVAFGKEVNISATGDGSAGFGLTTTAPATDPIISGAQSLGIFMGNHSARNFAAANTMGLFGGKLVIDPAVPATQLSARGVIDAGAATDAIVLPNGTTAQRPGTPVNGMIRYNSTSGKFEAYQAGAWTDMIGGGGGGTPGGASTQVQFNNGGAFGGDADLTWDNTGNVLTITGQTSVSDRVVLGATAGAAAPASGTVGTNAGVPAATLCDSAEERGRLIIDSTNNRLYVCTTTRGWDYVALTD